MPKLFKLSPSALSELLTCYWDILKADRSTPPNFILSKKSRIEKLVTREFGNGNLPDEDLCEIIWFIVGSKGLLHTLKNRGFLTPLIADIHHEVRAAFPSGPYYEPNTAEYLAILVF